MARQLIYYGHPILRKKSQPVVTIDEEIKHLIDDMFIVMERHHGGGLSACQVGVSLRIFIMHMPLYEEKTKSYLPGKSYIFINPTLSHISKEVVLLKEGCLSIPELRLPIKRPRFVTVNALDINGHSFTTSFSDIEARCIFHENDHLNGTLFIDRATPSEKKMIEPYLHEIKKRHPYK